MPAATKGREGGSINIKHRKPCKQQARAVEFTLLHLSDARRTSGYLWFYGFACWAFGHNRPPSNGYDTVGQPWTALEKSKIDSISARWSRTVTYGQVVHINKYSGRIGKQCIKQSVQINMTFSTLGRKRATAVSEL